jgi:hypothetical protein
MRNGKAIAIMPPRLKERHPDAGATIDEEWKGDRYNAAEDEECGGVRHAALGALHADEILSAEQVINAIDEINDSGNGVTPLQGVLSRSG